MTAAMLWDYTNNDNVFCLIFHRLDTKIFLIYNFYTVIINILDLDRMWWLDMLLASKRKSRGQENNNHAHLLECYSSKLSLL
jgi:hypothetical protein